MDMSHPEEPANRTLGAVYLRLPVAQDSTRAERAESVKVQSAEMKGSPEPLLAQGITALFGLLPQKLSNPIWHALSNKVTLSLSNLPGPPDNLTWCGVRMKSFYALVPPVGTISTFVLVTSYEDHIQLTLSLDGTIFSEEDGKFITDDFEK